MIINNYNNGSYNIHTIKTNRFKTNVIEVVFRNNVDITNIVDRTIMFDLLTDTNQLYNTRRELSLKLEYLYNSHLYTSSKRVGNQILNSIVIEYLNPKLIQDDINEECIKLLFDSIFKPNVINNEFNKKEVDIIKNELIMEKKTLLEDSRSVSFKKAYKELDKNCLLANDITGEISDIELVSGSSIYNAYLNSIKHDYIDIYVIGDIDENSIINLIDKYALFNTIKEHKLINYTNVSNRLKHKRIVDKSLFLQTNYINLYNLNNLNDYESLYVFNIYNEILGGSSLESKLNKLLRENNSLCYGAYSGYIKFDRIMFIHTMLDKSNVNKCDKLVKEALDSMNNISGEELSMAKNLIIASLNMVYDYPREIIREYMFRDFFNFDSIEDRIKKYNNVSIKDLYKLNNKIKLNLTYILEGDGNGEN